MNIKKIILPFLFTIIFTHVRFYAVAVGPSLTIYNDSSETIRATAFYRPKGTKLAPSRVHYILPSSSYALINHITEALKRLDLPESLTFEKATAKLDYVLIQVTDENENVLQNSPKLKIQIGENEKNSEVFLEKGLAKIEDMKIISLPPETTAITLNEITDAGKINLQVTM